MAGKAPSPQPFAEWLSDALQEASKAVVGTHREPPRRVKSLLHGTWFGHALQPVMTAVPLVAWLLTAICERPGPATVNAPLYDVRVRNGQVEGKLGSSA